jgi:hypothetical protein
MITYIDNIIIIRDNHSSVGGFTVCVMQILAPGADWPYQARAGRQNGAADSPSAPSLRGAGCVRVDRAEQRLPGACARTRLVAPSANFDWDLLVLVFMPQS